MLDIPSKKGKLGCVCVCRERKNMSLISYKDAHIYALDGGKKEKQDDAISFF